MYLKNILPVTIIFLFFSSCTTMNISNQNKDLHYTAIDNHGVTAIAVITQIIPTPEGNTGKGRITITDNDTGKTITAFFFSGGIPSGEPISPGFYDILQPTRAGHYRLEARDALYGNDHVEGTNQGLLRLHETGMGKNTGCISIETDAAWNKINEIFNNEPCKTVAIVLSKSRNPFACRTEILCKYGVLKVMYRVTVKTNTPEKGK